MITSLTDTQIARMAEYRDKWIKIGATAAAQDRMVRIAVGSGYDAGCRNFPGDLLDFNASGGWPGILRHFRERQPRPRGKK